MAITPNMDLDLPDVGVTPGPEWAQKIVDAFERVDEHDHSSSLGVKITPAGMNINTDFSIASYDLVDVRSVKLDDMVAALTGEIRSIYVKNGELVFQDGADNEVVITSGGAVAGSPGSIANLVSPAAASYSDITKKFSWFEDTNEYAKMGVSDLEVYEFGAVSPNPITIKSPASVASAYSFTLPSAVPTRTSPLLMSGAGVLAAAELTNGQLIIGSTAGAATAAALTATANQTTVTNGANSITIGTVQDIGTGSSPTFSTALVGSGAVGTPSLRFSTDTDTGIYRVTTNQLGIAAGGTNRFTVNTTGAGVNGTLTADALNIAAGGAFKVHLETSTSTSTSARSFTVSGATRIIAVMGMFRWRENIGGDDFNGYEPIRDATFSAPTGTYARFLHREVLGSANPDSYESTTVRYQLNAVGTFEACRADIVVFYI
jgi:hypothetical protein